MGSKVGQVFSMVMYLVEWAGTDESKPAPR